MLGFMNKIVKRGRDERGASGVEYGLLVAAIAAVIVVIAFALGSTLRQSFEDSCEAIAGGDTPATTCGPTEP